MKESTLIKTTNFLLFFSSALLFYGLTYYVTDEHSDRVRKNKPSKIEFVSVPTYCEPRPILFNPVFDSFDKFTIGLFETRIVIETEYIGEYFVTAYASAELGGSTATASGVECEYHEEWFIPTTCAIDPKLHSFGEYLMIDGKIYRCDDTGGNVKGRWVDCYVPDLESVWAWDTGTKSVHSVTITKEKILIERRNLYDIFGNHFLCWGVGDWFDRGNGR